MESIEGLQIGDFSNYQPYDERQIELKRCWCYTLNNWTEEEYALLINIKCNYHIIGKEIGKIKKLPHLQGFIVFKNQTSFSSCKKKIGLRASIRMCKGTPYENYIYCSKDKQFLEIGIRPVYKGKRVDIEELYEILRREYKTRTLIELMAEYGLTENKLKYIENYYNVLKSKDNENLYDHKKLPLMTTIQESWMKLLIEQDYRQILFVVNPTAGAGKTMFGKQLHRKFGRDNVCIIRGTEDDKIGDLTFVYKYEEYVVYDVTMGGTINYPFLEMLKDGIIGTNKYKSHTKFVGVDIKVIVLTNKYPDVGGNHMDPTRFVILEV